MIFLDFIADSLNEVGFAETGATVEKERVVTGARVFNDASCGSNSEVIVATYDKTIKSVFIVKAGGLGFSRFERFFGAREMVFNIN